MTDVSGTTPTSDPVTIADTVTFAASAVSFGAGQAVTLTVAAPATWPIAGPALLNVTIPVPVALSVRWSFTETVQGTQPGTTQDVAVPAADVRYLVGDASSPVVTVAFRPLATARTIKATFSGTLYSGDTTPAPVSRNITLTQAAVPDGVVESLLKAALRPEVPTPQVAPGEPLVARIVAATLPDPAGVVTEVQRSSPTVAVRGAVQVGPVVRALLSPLTSGLAQTAGLVDAATAAVGIDAFASSAVAATSDAVGALLDDTLSVPLAVDIATESVVRTVTPSPFAAVAAVDPDFVTSATPSGVVPLGAWPLAFSVTKVAWNVVVANTGPVTQRTLNPAPTPATTLFAVLPPVTMVGTNQEAAAGTATLTPTVTLATDVGTKSVALPAVSVTVLPLRIPETVIVFNTPVQENTAPVIDVKAAVCVTKVLAPVVTDAATVVTLFATARAEVRAVSDTFRRLLGGYGLPDNLRALGDLLAMAVRMLSYCKTGDVHLMLPTTSTNTVPPYFLEKGQVFNAGNPGVDLENRVRSLFSFGADDNSSWAMFFEGDVDAQGEYVALRGPNGGYAAAITSMNRQGNTEDYTNRPNLTWGVVGPSAPTEQLGAWEAILLSTIA